MTSDTSKERILRCPSCETLHIWRVSGKMERMIHDCGTPFEDITEEIEKYKNTAITDCYDQPWRSRLFLNCNHQKFVLHYCALTKIIVIQRILGTEAREEANPMHRQSKRTLYLKITILTTISAFVALSTWSQNTQQNIIGVFVAAMIVVAALLSIFFVWAFVADEKTCVS